MTLDEGACWVFLIGPTHQSLMYRYSGCGARCYKRYCDLVVGSVCRETCRRHKPLPRILFFNVRLLQENMASHKRINFIEVSDVLYRCPHIVLNSVCSIDTNYIYVMSQRTEKVQNLCKLAGLSDLFERFAMKSNGSS